MVRFELTTSWSQTRRATNRAPSRHVQCSTSLRSLPRGVFPRWIPLRFPCRSSGCRAFGWGRSVPHGHGLAVPSSERLNQPGPRNAIMRSMAKRPGDGNTLDGVTQINVRVNSGLYRQMCSVVNRRKREGDQDVSLSSFVRDGIVHQLNNEGN